MRIRSALVLHCRTPFTVFALLPRCGVCASCSFRSIIVVGFVAECICDGVCNLLLADIVRMFDHSVLEGVISLIKQRLFTSEVQHGR